MKIVIIGEYSGFAKNLSDGFRALGHDCFVFSWGDGYKKINQVNSYLIKDAKHSSRIINLLLVFVSLIENIKLKIKVYQMSKHELFDAALIMNSSFVKCGYKIWRPFFTKRMIIGLVNDPTQIYLSACGNDLCFHDFWHNKSSKVSYIAQIGGGSYQIKLHLKISSFVNKVIPVMYDYAQAWRHSKYAKGWVVEPTIPLPVTVENFRVFNTRNEKLIVFHGINRPDVKGTPYILEAMKKLEKNYPDKVECISMGGIPFTEYLEQLKRCDISVDQTYCYYTGMNGLFSLAMGKVLLSGNIKDNEIEYGCENIPIIDIGPDADQIYKELEKLVLDKEMVNNLSERSRSYVESVHSSQIVAQKYINIFRGNSRPKSK